MDLLLNILKETVYFFNEVAIYLLLGFAIAGLLHVLFPESLVRRHLGKDTFGSAFKATLFGIPLPICSCGVVPVAASLRKSGASKGSTISFLISTPQVGADSFLITYSLLGWVFGVFRIAAALITAFIAGILVNLFASDDKDGTPPSPPKADSETMSQRLKSVVPYMEYELLGPIANTLVIGMIVAGVIMALIPDGFIETWLGGEFLSMLLMLVIGIPLYICASASTPIAASLILKGLSPGAALVFLLTGPATNAMSLLTIWKIVGKRAAIIYLSSIALVSLALGFLLNQVVAEYGLNEIIMTHQHDILPQWLKIAGSVVLLSMLIWFYVKTYILDKPQETNMAENNITLNVNGMTCQHCASSVKKSVEAVPGTANVVINLGDKKVTFELANINQLEQIKQSINDAGFEVV